MSIIKIIPVPIETLKSQAVERVKNRHAKMLVKFMGDYTPAMRETFVKQLEWARGYQADQNAVAEANLEGMLSTQSKDALIAASQVPAQIVANKIIAKDASATSLIVIANRTLAEAEEAIEATTTPAELEAAMIGLADVEAAAIAELAALA